MSDKTKVLLADDHQLFRNGIKHIINNSELFEVVGEADSCAITMDKVSELSPKVILLDITMPDGNGLDLIEPIFKINNEIKIIMLSMHEDGHYIVQSVRKGAQGYLLKNADEQELLEALKTVVHGKKYFKGEVSEKMFDNISEHIEYKKLSNRELEVLKLVAAGDTTKMIADKLFVGVRTVETHRANMMKKLQVQNSAELIKKASELSII